MSNPIGLMGNERTGGGSQYMTKPIKALGLGVALALLAVACNTGGGATPAPTAGATAGATTPAATTGTGEGQYHIGYSNATGIGNGFREEQVCTAKAEALHSGEVSEMTLIHQDVDA